MSCKKVSGKTHTKEQLDNWANQNNPNNKAYRSNANNHANQLNPNNKAYRQTMDAGRYIQTWSDLAASLKKNS